MELTLREKASAILADAAHPAGFLTANLSYIVYYEPSEQELAALRNKGHTPVSVAHKLGISHTYVKRRFEHMADGTHVPIAGGPWSLKALLIHLEAKELCGPMRASIGITDANLLHIVNTAYLVCGHKLTQGSSVGGTYPIGGQQVRFSGPTHAKAACFYEQLKQAGTLVAWEYRPTPLVWPVDQYMAPHFKLTWPGGSTTYSYMASAPSHRLVASKEALAKMHITLEFIGLEWLANQGVETTYADAKWVQTAATIKL